MKSDLGSQEYSDYEQLLIQEITNKLKSRDHQHSTNYETGMRPRDYMFMYVKAAGALYEMCISLSKLSKAQGMAVAKTPADWFKIITGISLENMKFESTSLKLKGEEIVQISDKIQD